VVPVGSEVEETSAVIVGAGGFGREIVDVIDDQWVGEGFPPIRLTGFLDDGDPELERLARLKVPLLGSTSDAARFKPSGFLIGVGDGATRQRIDQALTGSGFFAVSVRHRLGSIGRDVHLGPGLVLCSGAVITTNVRGGRHLHVNLNATIGHDCVLGDYVTLSPGVNISGNVTVGDRVSFGTNASVLPGVSIGDDVRVGANAMVRSDVAPGATVVGVPARPI
jgi:sugar O-acyltransferase (sialic acid O-acetyltransferase NeuD family)